MSANYVCNFGVLTAQAPYCFENRQVRFTRTVLLQTLPSAYANRSVCRNCSCKRVHQRGLPDARFSSDKPDLTFAPQHSSQPAMHARESLIASDHACINKECTGKGVVLERVVWFGRLLLCSDLSDEAI